MGKIKDAARKAARKLAGGKAPPAPRPSPPRAKMTGKVKALLADFAGDTPHEAHAGRYSFCPRDRWHGKKLGAYDGWYSNGDWSVRIKGGAPVEAVRADQPEQPVNCRAGSIRQRGNG